MRRTSGAIIQKDLELMRLVGEQHGADLPGRDLAEAQFFRTYLLPDESDTTAQDS
jgi:hypothetical protein